MTELIDYDRLNTITAGDEDMKKELFELFFNTVDKCTSMMEAHEAEGTNHTNWRAGVHELKGASNNLGVRRTGEICELAENVDNITPQQKKEVREAILTVVEQIKAL